MPHRHFRLPLAAPFLALCLLSAIGTAAQAQMSGAIFTTDFNCNGTNINIFDSKEAVFLDGGPAHPGAAGLPDGDYYVKVTEPDGTLLGTTVGATYPTPVHVTDGSFDECYQLSDILIKASDSTPGYDTTTNGGGVYKVWASQDSTFPNSATKTDNFKVQESNSTPEAELHVLKFYDANVNGINDDGILLEGWKVEIADGTDYIRFTPVDITVAPDDYTVTEFSPLEPNWIHTTANPVSVTLADGVDTTVEFGNVCLGGGGGHTLGYWSNKNGQATMNDGGSAVSELALLSGLNLRNANGSNFDPTTYTAFRSWLLSATATNMAYMLSAQLAAMELNVEAGFVSGGALIYAPGAISANSLGFATVSDVMAEANTALGADGNTIAGDEPNRTYQEALKNAIDAANNNQNFVQATACPFSF